MGGFYRARDLLLDKTYLLSFGASIAFAMLGTTLGGIVIGSNRIDFDQIADVRFGNGRDIDRPYDTKPISDIAEIAAKNMSPLKSENSANETVMAGYVLNIDEICAKKTTEGGTERLVLVSSGGKTTVGKAVIGTKACEIINSIKSKENKELLLLASDVAPSPYARKSFVVLSNEKHP